MGTASRNIDSRSAAGVTRALKTTIPMTAPRQLFAMVYDGIFKFSDNFTQYINAFCF